MASFVPQRKAEPLHQGDILVVVHDFDARSNDELTLRKTERVELVELDDGFGDGWYLGRHLSRRATGLFPGVYTAKLPPHLAASSPSNAPKQYTYPPRPPLATSANTTSDDANDASHSPPQPSFAPYQHRSEPVAPDARSTTDGSLTYNQVSAYGSQRNTLPSTHGSYGAVQRSIGQALGDAQTGADSPVMNETLSVIDEHITDLSTPRQSLAPGQSLQDDSESEYSSHVDRASYVAGPETDDEENGRLTQAEVSKWDHKQTATHLRAIGVDAKHCDIFEEQEISGDVLLEMDQSFIYMKEYDFGVMGRRLKTWHKIRDFQNEVRGSKSSRQSSLNPGASNEDISRSQSRALSGSSILPRIPSLMEEPGLSFRQSQQGQFPGDGTSMPPPLQMQQGANSMSRSSVGANTPSAAWRASMSPESPSRPSAAQVREMSKSRRHSSVDFDKRQNTMLSSGSLTSVSTLHKKQTSLDREWSMVNATPSSTTATTPSTPMNSVKKQESLDMSADSILLTEAPNLDLDRGYFSGNELDNRKARNVLRKKDGSVSPGHSRQSSLLDETRKMGTTTKRHSRLSSVDSIRDQTNPIMSPAAKAYHSKYYKGGRFRSASARNLAPRLSAGGVSPTVTNLENEGTSPQAALPSPTIGGAYANAMVTVQSRARKLMGMRASSEAVTTGEKETLASPTIMTGAMEESPLASPDGSHTPSARSRSFEMDNTDSSSKGTDQIGGVLGPKPSTRAKPKTKQQTSAYTRGLLKISPEEARQHCDHHGWMKKKSSSLMTTWKPRLFILRGKRLSYYYSENDTEERGIIDISGHKVLVANSDPITTLHATITGATASASPTSGATSSETSPILTKTANIGTSGPFYFKLVPPKAGLSRAVQFTKPTIHYFQVDTAAEGRKWMGEIMKATIEHDLTSFETTNKQKTISLAKARARKERPPALKETISGAEAVIEEKKDRESGLNIQGLTFEGEGGNLAEAIAAEQRAPGLP